MGLVVLALAVLGSPGQCATVAEAKSAVEGTVLTIQGTVTYVDSQECYIESSSRCAGILVQGQTYGCAVGDLVDVVGVASQIDGAPAITASSITLLDSASVPTPLGVGGRAMGGISPPGLPAVLDYVPVKVPGDGWVRQWMPAAGLGSRGLLIKTWGTVKNVYYSPSTGVRWFYIDDGSDIVSDLGDIGVAVCSDADVKKGDFVSVTGIATTEPALDGPDRLIRVVMPRSTDDVSVLRPNPMGEHPFSDEFDSSKLDPRWAVAVDQGVGGLWSLNDTPGFLTLVAATSNTAQNVYHRTQVGQLATGDWDLEVRVRLTHQEGIGMQHGFTLLLSQTFPHRWLTYVWPRDEYTFLAGARYTQLEGDDPPYRLIRAGVDGEGWIAREGDVCFFRASKRGDSVQTQYSRDGVDYSVTGTTSIIYPCPYFVASVQTSTTNTGYCSAAIDYIRFTPFVSEGESAK